MNNLISRKTLILICAILLSTAIFLSLGNRTSAYSPQDMIRTTLSSLGITDAAFAEKVNDPGGSNEDRLLYTSSATQMGYYFDPNTGALTDIFHFSIMGDSYEAEASTFTALSSMQVSAEHRETDLLAYAESCIGEALIGELHIEPLQNIEQSQHYTVIETYDGIETGTGVFFSCDPSGQITMCNITIGQVFQRSDDGTQVIANGEALIGEEAAVEIARAGLEAMEINTKTISDDATCELTAAEDLLIYTVRIRFTDGSDNVREYLAGVNAHTGELWREAISK